ncbi:hypothetical protein C2W62_46540 [Candidatus Entotheonella serta]|nr:hypothetical protein C2W62_46540 [Candidatus Entotheonella serta]
MRLEWAVELTIEQIKQNRIDGDQARALVAQTFDTMRAIETPASEFESEPARDWQSSITQHDIRCLECGASMRTLTQRHLQRHDLTPKSYRDKYGIPREQPLSSRAATRRRLQIAKETRPWELRQKAAKRRRRSQR